MQAPCPQGVKAPALERRASPARWPTHQQHAVRADYGGSGRGGGPKGLTVAVRLVNGRAANGDQLNGW